MMILVATQPSIPLVSRRPCLLVEGNNNVLGDGIHCLLRSNGHTANVQQFGIHEATPLYDLKVD
jgi:hypothetical protein